MFILVVPVNEARAQSGWIYTSGVDIMNTNPGNVGIGMAFPVYKLHVIGSGFFDVGGTGGGVYIGTPATESGLNFTNTNRADIRFDNSTLKLVVGSGTGVPASTNGIVINTSGNVGIGTNSPSARLDVNGTIGTTGSAGTVTTQSVSTIGWYDKSVTFPFAFGAVPNVTLTQDNSGTGDISIISFRVRKGSLTSTGFTIDFYVNAIPTSGTTKFNWLAL